MSIVEGQKLENRGKESEHNTIVLENRGKRSDQTIVILADRIEKLAASTAASLEIIKRHENTISWTQQITYFGFLVLVLMVAGMLIDLWNSKGVAIENLTQQLREQTIAINKLSDHQNSCPYLLYK